MPRTDTCDSVSLLVQVSEAEFAAGYQTTLQPLLAPSGNPQISCEMTATLPPLLSHRALTPVLICLRSHYAALILSLSIVALLLLHSHCCGHQYRSHTTAGIPLLSHRGFHTSALTLSHSTGILLLLILHCCIRTAALTIRFILFRHCYFHCTLHCCSRTAPLTLFLILQLSHFCAHSAALEQCSFRTVLITLSSHAVAAVHTVVSHCCCCVLLFVGVWLSHKHYLSHTDALLLLLLLLLTVALLVLLSSG